MRESWPSAADASCAAVERRARVAVAQVEVDQRQPRAGRVGLGGDRPLQDGDDLRGRRLRALHHRREPHQRRARSSDPWPAPPRSARVPPRSCLPAGRAGRGSPPRACTWHSVRAPSRTQRAPRAVPSSAPAPSRAPGAPSDRSATSSPCRARLRAPWRCCPGAGSRSAAPCRSAPARPPRSRGSRACARRLRRRRSPWRSAPAASARAAAGAFVCARLLEVRRGLLQVAVGEVRFADQHQHRGIDDLRRVRRSAPAPRPHAPACRRRGSSARAAPGRRRGPAPA